MLIANQVVYNRKKEIRIRFSEIAGEPCMNDRKFCFIMCTNREDYKEEALLYLSMLSVPEGYETEVLPEDAVMWHGVRCGNIYGVDRLPQDGRTNAIYPVTEPFREIEAADGLLMITQYDILWREDILKAWDFYDVSQCMEFRRRGYKVVVPHMEKPWCFHDCGLINLENYDRERQIFLKAYGKQLSDRDTTENEEAYGKNN